MKKAAANSRLAVNILLLAILAGTVLWLARWAPTHIEFYEETIDLGWSPRARANPFLAAEQFLERLGVTVTTARSLQSLEQLPANGTVFISNSRQVLSERRSQALVEWIQAGGHIIIAAQESDPNIPDPLLQHFQVTRSLADIEEAAENADSTENEAPPESDPVAENSDPPKKLSEQLREQNRLAREKRSAPEEEDKTDSEDEALEREEYEASIPAGDLTQLRFQSLERDLTIQFAPHFVLDHPALRGEEGYYQPLYWAGSDQGVHFMQFDVGAGLLSVLSDARIWRSSDIEYFDNAYLLAVLAGRSPAVTILYGAEMPSLWQLLWEHTPEWLFAAGLWLALWLLYRARRFGPVQKQTIQVRRSMAEHIYACADFLWQRCEHGQLVATVRRDTLRHIERRYPVFAGLSAAAQKTWLLENTDLCAEEIDTALFAEVPPGEAQFARVITLLQKLLLQNRLLLKQGTKK